MGVKGQRKRHTRQQEYVRQAMARVNMAEVETNATILRAFDRYMFVLQRERTEMRIRQDRRRRKVR